MLPLIFVFGLFVWTPSISATPAIEAYLYNPTADQITMQYPYNKAPDTLSLKPSLNLVGSDFPDGDSEIHYVVEENGKALYSGTIRAGTEHGHFNDQVELPEKYAHADSISWRVTQKGAEVARGRAKLTWSRFHGKVVYKSGVQRSTAIDLIPLRWGDPGEIQIPVATDGSFDALVPARVYAILNASGAGYLFDSMERWAGTYDLTHDREDQFDIGRTEIYGLRAFDITGGPKTIYLFFRPSSLSRVMSFHASEEGILNADEKARMVEALKSSPMAIAPELTARNVRVWFDDQPLTVAQLNQIPEFDSGTWQANYIVQCPLPSVQISKNVWHHIRVEVESQELLRGKKITDFGQSSVDVFWPR